MINYHNFPLHYFHLYRYSQKYNIFFFHLLLEKINEKESSKNTGEQEFQCTDALNDNTLNTRNNDIIKCIKWIVIYYANKR